MAIDWDATGSMLSGWGSLLGAGATTFGGVAVLIAAKRAATTFEAWKEQKREERRMELAEQTLALAYRVRNAFAAIRSPASFGGEHDQARKKLVEGNSIREGQDDPVAQRLITAQIALLRLAFHQKTWDALAELTPTVKAVFGNALFEQLEGFWKLQGKVHSAAIIYGRTRELFDPTREQIIEHNQMQHDLERSFWAMPMENEPDEIADSVDAIIDTLETELAPIIRTAVA